MAKQQRSLLKRRKPVTLVLSTLHTNSTTETLVRLQQMGVARWMLSSALTLVIAQRLVRKLCPHCRLQQGGAHPYSRQCMATSPLPPLASTRLCTLLPRFLWSHGLI